MYLKHREKDHLQSGKYSQHFLTILRKACLEPRGQRRQLSGSSEAPRRPLEQVPKGANTLTLSVGCNYIFVHSNSSG